MKDEGFAYMSEGALVVDVKEETDAQGDSAVYHSKV